MRITKLDIAKLVAFLLSTVLVFMGKLDPWIYIIILLYNTKVELEFN